MDQSNNNTKSKRRVAILGSTGSIGVQALEVIESNSDYLEAEVLVANSNANLLIEQAKRYKPNVVVIGNEDLYNSVNDQLDPLDIKVYAGAEAISSVVTMDSVDIVLTAIVGFAGLKPTIAAINANKPIALANKETLVVAGQLITDLAKQNGVNIYPVDSEHSAIFQCLAGEFENRIEKLILTASGGPFRGKDREYLANVTKEQALKHPNWDMGPKITIDSATLMNKGLEVIEAKWLFGVDADQIDVVVHPQSIIHSMVQFEDASIKAQMGLPDMKVPIQYALAYPHRIPNSFERLNFADFPTLSFEEADVEAFRGLGLAYEALNSGGNIPCVLNAANEVVVDAFLKDAVGFLEMSEIVETCLAKISFIKSPDLDAYLETDAEARRMAKELIYNKIEI